MSFWRQYAFCAEKEDEGMNQYTYEGNNQKIIEQFLIFVFTIYSCIMIIICIKHQESVYGALFLLATIMLCWVIHVAKAWSYETRALFNVSVMLAGISIFSCILKSMDKMLPMFMVFIVLVGLYGIDKLIYLVTVATVLLYCYHGLILQSFSVAMPE